MIQVRELTRQYGRKTAVDQLSFAVIRADEHQIQHPYGNKPAVLPATRPLPHPNQQVSDVCSVLNPTRHPARWYSWIRTVQEALPHWLSGTPVRNED